MTARRRARLAAIVGFVIGGFLVVVAPGAGAGDAASIDDAGWWARTNQDPLLGPAASGADVTPGQLVVEGTPEGATAIAALRATLPPDTGSPVLTLQVASQVGADGAILLACQAGSGWTGAHAGAWSSHPNPDCAQSVQGIPSEDGTAWTFGLGPLQFGDQLDVVFTPGVDETRPAGLDGSAFRLVFERPSASSIQVTEADVGFSPNISLPPLDFDSSSSSGGSSGSFTPSFTPIDTGSTFTPPAPLTDDALSQQPARAALPADEQGQTATAPVLSAQNPLRAAAIDDAGDAARFLGIFVVLCAGALMAWSTTQEVPERMVLSRFAATASSHETVAAPREESEGGLGRFRRLRTTPARRLGG